MAPWAFDMKFPLGTQFTFGSLIFTVGEDRDLKMLLPGPALEHPTPAPSSTSGSTYSSLDLFVGLYMCHLTTDRHDASWGAASHVVSRVGQAVHEMVIPWRTHRRGLELWWWCLLRLFCCCLRHGWRLSPEATTELIKLLDIK
jgi:hypothetical protein